MSTGMDFKLRRVKARRTQADVARIVRLSRSWVAKVESMRGPVPAEAAKLYDTVLRTFEHVSDEGEAA
jgi:transcriptional regulator with XRE-family HTH domain